MSDRFITISLAAVFTILVGFIIGVEQLIRHVMYGLHMDAENIAQGQWLDVELASQALEYSDQNLQTTVQIVLSDQRPAIESLIKRRADNTARVSALLARKDSTPYTPTGVHDYMHMKAMVTDDLVTTGSYNFSANAERNAENQITLNGADVVGAYVEYLTTVIAAYGGPSQ